MSLPNQFSHPDPKRNYILFIETGIILSLVIVIGAFNVPFFLLQIQ